jgi:antitoxin component YwqK of YwqJK toxin-antitoxin module
VSLLGAVGLVAGSLWWWGYFYPPVKFDATYDGGQMQALVLVHRRRAFQIPTEIWGDEQRSTFSWYWLPEVTSFYPNGNRREHGWCRPFPVQTGSVERDKPRDMLQRAGLITGWHETGNKSFETRYRDGVKDGPSRTFHINGKIKEDGGHRDGKRDGLWKTWHDNGQLEGQGEFLDDKPHGQWTTWHANGQQRAQPMYERGLLIGEEAIFDDQGRLTSRKHWVQGQEHGLRESILPHGRRVVQHVQADRLQGEHREFDAEGRLLVEGQYEGDKMQGRWRDFFPDGRPKWERQYLDDKLNGPERVWRADGTLESEGNYAAGERHGAWIDWDAAGKKQAEGEYRQGRRLGTWSFYELGRLSRSTRYDDGRVVETKEVSP